MNNVLITKELFGLLVQFHLAPPPYEDDLCELERTIKTQLLEKIDSMIRHEYYTSWVQAKTAEEKEAARIRYLDAAGILSGWRYHSKNPTVW